MCRKVQDEAVANLLAQYSLANLLEGLGKFLEGQESQLYNFLKDKAYEEGMPSMHKTFFGQRGVTTPSYG